MGVRRGGLPGPTCPCPCSRRHRLVHVSAHRTRLERIRPDADASLRPIEEWGQIRCSSSSRRQQDPDRESGAAVGRTTRTVEGGAEVRVDGDGRRLCQRGNGEMRAERITVGATTDELR